MHTINFQQTFTNTFIAIVENTSPIIITNSSIINEICIINALQSDAIFETSPITAIKLQFIDWEYNNC